MCVCVAFTIKNYLKIEVNLAIIFTAILLNVCVLGVVVVVMVRGVGIRRGIRITIEKIMEVPVFFLS